MSISAKDVMNLRNKTGLAMMECKKALQEADGNVEEAENLLRKKLKGKMEKKSDRIAGEGRVEVAVSDDGSSGSTMREVLTLCLHGARRCSTMCRSSWTGKAP